jgi:protein-tyrosine phosphatase
MTERPETFSVLVVCDGNVCRSAYAEYLLGERMPYARVRSAGAHAKPGTALCSLVASSALGADSRALTFAESFRSRSLSGVDLTQFQLVLAATAELRGELARTAPALRDSFFSLTEAASIVTAPSFLLEQGAPLSQLPSAMNRSRGLVPRPAVLRPLIRRRETHDSVTDIVDGHHASAKHHAAAIAAVARASDSIADALDALLPSHS